ncbi:MAG: hydroxylamine reductase [Candidatus Eisenbacteria bacterium]|nr:hydroxylamine reductase [Candidatus Eisenbacteria bacterium]
MYCYQCEQAAQGVGCTVHGACGKDPDVAALQDLLVHIAKGTAQYAVRARRLGAHDPMVDHALIEALFTTVTNVSFEGERVAAQIRATARARRRARTLYLRAALVNDLPLDTPARTATDRLLDAAEWDEESPGDTEAMIAAGRRLQLASRLAEQGAAVTGLQEMVLYGLKGSAAYLDHAWILGYEAPGLHADFQRLLAELADEPSDADRLVEMALEEGALNLRVMELLDRANTESFGHPEPSRVRVSPRRGKCILVSGHDLKDLDALLQQTAGQDIDVYTHGELLPALAYPGLRKYPHLAGNYGGAWQDQRHEFEAFPGAILMTTNCIQAPRDSYRSRIFTTGLVAWPGVTHIADRDFTPVIEAARAAEGFAEDAPEAWITIGFGRQALLSAVDRIVAAIQNRSIRHLFLVGGCDGAKPGRNYYTEFVEAVPHDCVLLTLACGKFRFNKLAFGEIGGLPRLLDAGQCNDAYAAIQVVLALARALECEVDDLPLSLVLSWYEQKAVCILLTLLHLGIKDIRIGPTLPAFLGPGVRDVLQKRFGLRPTSDAREDLHDILGGVPSGA